MGDGGWGGNYCDDQSGHDIWTYLDGSIRTGPPLKVLPLVLRSMTGFTISLRRSNACSGLGASSTLRMYNWKKAWVLKG